MRQTSIKIYRELLGERELQLLPFNVKERVHILLHRLRILTYLQAPDLIELIEIKETYPNLSDMIENEIEKSYQHILQITELTESEFERMLTEIEEI